MERHIVQVKDVSYRPYDQAEPIIEQLHFTVPQGQWLGVVGPNGSGKSTLIRLLCGLLPHSSGTITIDGIVLNEQTVWDVREKIGIVFANPDNQFVGTTVAEDIVFGLENRCMPRELMVEKLHHYAAKLRVSHLLDRHPGTLSGGQKQRVAIAAILVSEPKIIMFDEATSMIDEQGKRDILDMIQQLKDSGQYTIISVTHDQQEMLATDRIIALAERTIITDEEPRTLLQNEALLSACHMQMPYTVQLCRQLQRHGIEIGTHFDEKELTEALWAFNLNR